MPADDKASGSKPGESSSAKPVYKLIVFEDTSQKSLKTKTTASWTTHKKTADTWVDQTKVERAVKESGASDFFDVFLKLGPRRREIVDDYISTLNETDKSGDYSGPWQGEYLFQGDDVIDKRTGLKIRTPLMFWLIVKRMKKAPGNPKGILVGGKDSKDTRVELKDSKDSKDNRDKDKDTYGKSGSKDSGKKDMDSILMQQLLQALTMKNTADNSMSGMDIQSQIQAQVQMAMRQQSQFQQNQALMFNQMPPPYQEPHPMNAHNGLPSVPVVPGNMYNSPYNMSPRHSPEHSPQMMHSSFNTTGYGNFYSQPGFSSSRGRLERLPIDENEYNGTTHLDAIESPNYPRGGIGSRRHSISMGSHPYQDEMLRGQLSGGYNPAYNTGYGADMNNMSQWPMRTPMQMVPNPTMDLAKVRQIQSWESAVSSADESGDEMPLRDSVPRIGRISRAESMHSHGSRQRSRSRGGNRQVMIDSGAAGGRRNSISHTGMHGVTHNKGFGMTGIPDNHSDDMTLGLGRSESRMTIHGMGIDRNATRTPFLGHR
ncbi:hypothetical protein ABW19_dt0208917 [Dactylella cylindrospora]|nr:hypothetical protein ABW19_dt0208917 [Dactylella cylindrospora]